MILLVAAWGCSAPPPVTEHAPPAGTAPSVASPAPASSTSTLEWPPVDVRGDLASPVVSCPLEPGWDDYPGGLAMRLDTDPLADGEPLEASVSGAVPGDVIDLEIGLACTYSCGRFAGGGCRVAVAPLPLDTTIADGLGNAAFTVPLPAGLPDDAWLVLQARVDGATFPYVSEPVFDHLGPSLAPTPVPGATGPGMPSVIRGVAGGASFSFQLPAGRSAALGLEVTTDFIGYSRFYDENPETFPYGLPGVGPFETTGPAFWAVPLEYDYLGDGTSSIDVAMDPLPSAVPWYPDTDGDGFGDPAGATVLSTTPIPGMSADPRDCDDADAEVFPFAPESCGDAADQDCDGVDRPCAPAPGEVAELAAGAHVWEEPGIYPDFLNRVDVDGAPGEGLFASPGGVLEVDGRRDVEASDAVVLAIPDGVYGLATGDLTGDNVPDVVDHNGYVLAGPVTDYLAAPLVGEVARPNYVLQTADANGDGIADVLLHDGTAYRWYDGPISQNPAASAVLDADEASVVLGDVDGDGLDDLWAGPCLYRAPFASHAPPDSCFAGEPTASWDVPHRGAVGDLDGDGNLDVALLVDGVSVGPATGGPDLLAWRTASTAGSSVAIVGDREDGLLAISGVDSPTATLVFDRPTGALDPALATFTIDLPGESLVSFDADGDGVDELAIAGSGQRGWAPAYELWILPFE